MRTPQRSTGQVWGRRGGAGEGWGAGNQFGRKDNADLNEGDGHRHRQCGSFSEDSMAQ